MTDIIQEFFEDQISFKGTGEIVDEIRQEREKLMKKTCHIPPEQAEKIIRKTAKSIRNEVCECIHPLVKKMINWGYLKGRTKYGRALEEVIKDLLANDVKSSMDVRRLEEKIEEFKREMMEKIGNIIEGMGSDLRPLHAPGSVSRDEARNLYFGEIYTKHVLLQLGTQLLSSICIGENFGVYFTDEKLRDEMWTELLRNFGTSHILSQHLHRLYIYWLERDKPYIVFIKFLLWLHERYEIETAATEKERLYRILNLLKETDGIIYFAPGVDKAKYSTIPLPRLDFFFSNWLDVKKRKDTLKRMRDSLYYFMQNIIRSATRKNERKTAQNRLALLATYYDMFCAELLRSGFIRYEPMRRIIDLMVELSNRYKDVHVNLFFVKELTFL